MINLPIPSDLEVFLFMMAAVGLAAGVLVLVVAGIWWIATRIWP